VRTIPAFFHVDVEPDGFQTGPEEALCWPGYEGIFEFVRDWRRALAAVSPGPPRFGWYFRMDPQVAALCGRADHAVRAFPERLAELRRAGDHFGAHCHPLRWSEERGAWVHEVADSAWLRECTRSTLRAFEASMGERARRFRCGACVFHDAIFDVLEEEGVEVDTSLEPLASWGLHQEAVHCGSDTSPIEGAYLDCSRAPCVPYRPDPTDFRRPGRADARRLALVPVTTAPRKLPPSSLRRLWKRLRGRPARPAPHASLYPFAEGPGPRRFWDLAAHALEGMERPYLSLAVRTDAPDSASARRIRAVLSALPHHPLARRLRFGDPLDSLGYLLPESGATAPPPAHTRPPSVRASTGGTVVPTASPG